jgi:hypothetical protein
MPQGGTAQFMKTNVRDLVNGEASLAADDRTWSSS